MRPIADGLETFEASSTFDVTEFEPVDWAPEVTTGLNTGQARMVKTFEGDLAGRAITQFCFCFDQARGVGTYVATESFEGSLGDRSGAFNFVHSATDRGDGVRAEEFFLIVPKSGTGDLTGIRGTGAISVDEDGHRLTLTYGFE